MNKKQALSAQVKKGLARAFTKFSEYQLAKYNRMREVSLRDVMFLCHPSPKDKAQAAVFKRLANDDLKTPDTWEVALSAGKDKKKTFERLIEEDKLGGLALLRNLRGMREAGVSQSLVRQALRTMKADRILPVRFIAAARYAPDLEPELEQAMFRCLEGADKLPGRTILVVDVSGSMTAPLGGKSELTRLDTAAALAMLAREVCEDVSVYITGGNDYSQVHLTKLVPARRGFALADVIRKDNCGGGGIFLTQCMEWISKQENVGKTPDACGCPPSCADRVIVITDEQDCDRLRKASGAMLLAEQNYVINIASAKNGVGYGPWTHIDGWSESVIDYIRESEKGSAQ